MPQSQPINSSQTDGLSSQFQRRWESVYHWRSMCSMLLGTPGLRAAWPMSSVDYTQPECTDISGHGHHLQAAAALGNVTFGYDNSAAPKYWAPIANLGGAANQYLSRADGGAANWADIGIAGGDVQFPAAQQGLTLGGWFYWSALPGAPFQQFMGKDDRAAQRQYFLGMTGAANTISFVVHPGGITVTSAAALVVGWNHIVGIYDKPNVTLHIVLNGVRTLNLAGVPANLNDSTAPFTIGADGAGASRMTGYASDCFLCAQALRASFVRSMYHYTKAAYGVK